MINVPFTIGIALAAVIIDRSIINKASGSAYSNERSNRLGRTLIHAALVPALLAVGAVIAGLISHFVLRRFRLEYLDSTVFILAILCTTLISAEAALSGKGKPGSLNRMLSGAAAIAVLLGLASSLSTANSSLTGTGAALWAGVAWFVLFPAYCGVREKMGLGIRVQGVFMFSRELVIAGLLALVAVGSIASLHH